MKKTCLVIAILSTLSACGGSSGSGATPTPTPTPSPSPAPTPAPPADRAKQFPNSELWGNEVRYFKADQLDRNSILSLRSGPDGRICYIERQVTEEDHTIEFASWTSQVVCKNGQGEVDFTLARQGVNIIKDLLIKPDGHLIVAHYDEAQIHEDDSGHHYYLAISEYSPSGERIRHTQLPEALDEQEAYYYTFTAPESAQLASELESGPNGVYRRKLDTFATQGKALVIDNAKMQMKWHDNGLYVMAYTTGVKLYRLSESLDVTWQQQAMPAHTWLWTSGGSNTAALAVGGGEVFVAFEVLADEAHAYDWHFNRALGKTTDDKDIAVSVFSQNGEYSRSFLLGNNDEHEQLVGIEYRDAHLWIGGNVRKQKYQQPNYTTEWDLMLMKTTADHGDERGYYLIDHDREDLATQFIPMNNNNFLFAGATGYRQVDSNSIVSYGKGMVLQVNQSGEAINHLVLDKPRHIVIDSVALTEDDKVIFSGVYDGPITHTCDNDESLCYQKGMAGVASLVPIPE